MALIKREFLTSRKVLYKKFCKRNAPINVMPAGGGGEAGHGVAGHLIVFVGPWV